MSTRTAAYRDKLRNGEFDLGWMDVNSEWGVKAQPSKRGLTLNDINIGSYGVIPEDASDSLSFAPRGADFNPDELPSMGEMIAQNEAEKHIFRLCAQDEARHVAFGCLQLRKLVEEDADRVDEIHEALDVAEQRTLELGATPEQIEPFLILLGGGEAHMDVGLEKFGVLRKKLCRNTCSAATPLGWIAKTAAC